MKRLSLLSSTLLLSLCTALPALARDTCNHACAPAEMFAPGVISRPGIWESRITFTSDRRRVLFNVGQRFLGERELIMLSEVRNGRWSEPVVAPFSGVYEDSDPFFSPDGRTLYFNSRRPISGSEPREDGDLWSVSVGRDGSFGTPVHLGAGPNTEADEFYASIDRDGTLYFASNRDGGQWDIYRSSQGRDGRFGAAEKLGTGVNTPDFWEYNPEISPNGKTLLFASLNRPDSLGWGDLYVSRERRATFAQAQNLGPCVNSAADEYHPTMLWDEGQLFFVRNVIEDPDWIPDFFSVPLDLED
jgi:hypothetical protein